MSTKKRKNPPMVHMGDVVGPSGLIALCFGVSREQMVARCALLSNAQRLLDEAQVSLTGLLQQRKRLKVGNQSRKTIELRIEKLREVIDAAGGVK